jgi:GPI mannosyltransferase 3
MRWNITFAGMPFLNTFSRSPYRKWFIAALLVQVVTAWFSVGYNHPDEHFQILEFCNYKMGFSPASALPWEFAKQCRSGLQPFIAYYIAKPLYILGLYNPFTVAFLLRLLIGIASWCITCRLVWQLLGEFVTEKGKKLFVWCSMLLWFVPYLGVRFSPENFSALLFLLSCSLLLQLQQNNIPTRKRILLLIITGLALGFCFSVRLQMAFAMVGIAIWLLFIKKWQWKEWVLIAFSAIIAIGISTVIDHWLYGNWVFTPYNYYYVNIVQHAAAKFGVFPWWWYIQRFIEAAIPPISIVLLIAFLYGATCKPIHLLTIACLAFIIGHCAIGHKEMRFLFPMAFPFIFIAAVGIDRMLLQFQHKKVYDWILNILIAMNIAVLIYKAFTPAEEAVAYYAYLYKPLSQPNTIVINNPYRYSKVNVNFYRPHTAEVIVPDSSNDISGIIDTTKGKTIYYFSNTLTPDVKPGNFELKKVYSLIPDWVLKHNINDWESRSHIWSIYLVEPK